MSFHDLPRPLASRRNRFRLLALGASAVLLTGCAGAPQGDDDTAEASENFPIELTSCEYTATLDSEATSAITLNQGATEVVLALGAEGQLAGTAYLDDEIPEKWRAAYESVPVLSDAYPDSESVLAADPDLLYASYISAFSAENVGTREELSDSDIATYVSPLGCGSEFERPEVSFETVWGEIDDVAAAFGVTERAEQLREDQQKVLDDLGAEAAGDGTEVFWYDGGDDVPTAGAGGGGPQLVLDAIGATNIFADQEGGWADVSWEQVVAADPEVIVFADAAWSPAQDKIDYLLADPVLSQLTAVRTQAFITIPFAESTPGVRLVDGAASVADQLAALG